MANDDTTNNGDRCTCTGGPYIHGPLGLALVKAQIEAKKAQEAQQQEEKK